MKDAFDKLDPSAKSTRELIDLGVEVIIEIKSLG
jgi:hypothetical protein